MEKPEIYIHLTDGVATQMFKSMLLAKKSYSIHTVIGTVTFDFSNVDNLTVAKNLQSWLNHRLEKED